MHKLFIYFIIKHLYSIFHYKNRVPQLLHPTFLIAPTISQSSVFDISSHSVSHTDYSALCRVLSCALTAPALPSYNPALFSYIPLSDCGLYYCFPLSIPTNIPNLSDFALPCSFRKGLFLLRIANIHLTHAIVINHSTIFGS